MSEPKFSLVDFTQEEVEKFNAELTELCNKHSAIIFGVPHYDAVGNGSFVTKASVVAKKKVELVPKEEKE